MIVRGNNNRALFYSTTTKWYILNDPFEEPDGKSSNIEPHYKGTRHVQYRKDGLLLLLLTREQAFV